MKAIFLYEIIKVQFYDKLVFLHETNIYNIKKSYNLFTYLFMINSNVTENQMLFVLQKYKFMKHEFTIWR